MNLATTNETKQSLVSIVDDEAYVRESLGKLRPASNNADQYASAGHNVASGMDYMLAVEASIRLGRIVIFLHPEKPQKTKQKDASIAGVRLKG